MNRIVWTLLSGVLLAGCQSSPFQTANREPMRPSGDADRRSRRDDRSQNGPGVGDRRDSSLIASRMGAGDLVGPRRSRPSDSQTQTGTDDRSRYERMLAQNPDNPFAHHKLAILADKSGDFASANTHYRAALRLDEKNDQLLSNFGYSKLLQDRLEDAEYYLRQAHRLNPTDKKINANLGTVYAKQGRAELAYNHLRQAGGDDYARSVIADSIRNGGGLRETQFAGSRRSPSSNLQAPDPTGYGQSPGFASRGDRFVENAPNEETRRVAEMMSQARNNAMDRRDRNSNPNGYDVRNLTGNNQYQFTGFGDRDPRDPRALNSGRSYDNRSFDNRYDRNDVGTRDPNFPPLKNVPDSRMNDALRRIDAGNNPPGHPIRQAGGPLPDWNDRRFDNRGLSSNPEQDRNGSPQPAGSRQPDTRNSPLFDPKSISPGQYGTSARPASSSQDFGSSRGYDDRRDLPSQLPRDNGSRYETDGRSTSREPNAAERQALLIGHNTGSGALFPIHDNNAMKPGPSGDRTGDPVDGRPYTRFDRDGTVTRTAGYGNSDPNNYRDNRDTINAPRYDARGNGYDDGYRGISIQPRVKTGVSYGMNTGRSP